MTRPVVEGKRVTTSLRLSRELLDQVDAAAAERGVGRNWLLVRFVSEGLDSLIPVDELVFTRRGSTGVRLLRTCPDGVHPGNPSNCGCDPLGDDGGAGRDFS